MSGRPKNHERVYYEELFETLGIPFRRRGTKLYFINPITERQNDVTLVNLRRVVNQMINSGDLDSDWEYEEENEPNNELSFDSDSSNIEEEKEEDRVTYDNPTFSKLYRSLKEKRGQLVRVVIYIDGNIGLDLTRRVPEIGFGGFWQELTTYELIKDSDNPLIPTKEYTGSYGGHTYSMDVITIQEIKGGEPVIQHFQDGFKHCILHPIKEWAEGCLETSKSERTERRYKKILKDINELLIKYKNGVPQHQLQAICELLQIDIKVDLPLDIDEPFLFCKSTKKRLKVFEFINTRLDHVDLNEFVLNEPIKNVIRHELYNIKEDLESRNQYYIYQKDIRGLSSITSFQGKYTINNEYSTVKNNFEEKNKLTGCKIDDIADSKLSAFIKCGTHYNGTVDFKDTYIYERHLDEVKRNDELRSSSFLIERCHSVKHIDMSKAYANFHRCKWYEGFMGKITDYRKTDKIVSNGLYLVSKFDFKDVVSELNMYNDILRIYHNNNIYGSPELKMLSFFGVKYTIKAGCWGVKSIDFRFNDDMLNKKDSDGNKFYAKWTGASDQHKLEQSFFMKGDRDLFKNIRNYVSDGTVRWVGVDEGCISYKKDRNFHLGHITAQITMYMRMNMMEQLLEMDITKVIRVCVDGIYYLDHDFKICNVFRLKEDITFENGAGDRYASNIFLGEDNDTVYDKIQQKGEDFAEEREHFGKELHLGAGGTGKTHKALTDKGFIRVLYVAPSRKLVRKKNADYAITSDVLSNLIINDSTKYDKIARFFNVLVLDEVSMYSEKNKQAIFSRFENHKLIFCGDVGYQLPTWGDEPITTEGFDLIKTHKENYRIQCPELKNLCEMLRDLITKGIETNQIDNYKYRRSINKKVEKFFIKRNRMIDHGELQELYNIKDYILVGTKKIGWEYTEMFKGKFEEEKYYVTSNVGDFSNGDVICNKEKLLSSGIEVRHHFTTHSIQGETLKPPVRIFIDCSKMFDSRMFYTAISRARRLSQIYLVKKVNI